MSHLFWYHGIFIYDVHFGFCGLDFFSLLIEMAFGCGSGFDEICVDVLDGEAWPCGNLVYFYSGNESWYWRTKQCGM